MKKINFIILLFLFPQNFSFSQNKKMVEWSSKKKLTWNDFIGTPDDFIEYEALTSSKIKYEIITNSKNQINYEITNFFVKTNSWSKDKSSMNLLRHENLHFDISEVITRKIRKEFSQFDLKDLQGTIKELDSLFLKKAIDERDFMNSIYDEETSHGTFLEKQKEWEEKVAKELKELEKFASKTVTVRRKKDNIVKMRKKKKYG